MIILLTYLDISCFIFKKENVKKEQAKNSKQVDTVNN